MTLSPGTRVERIPSLRVSPPRRLFSGRYVTGDDTGQSFAITPDGRRFILLQLPPGTPSPRGFATELLVVQNWFGELRARGTGKER